jgi:hypothetical protein
MQLFNGLVRLRLQRFVRHERDQSLDQCKDHKLEILLGGPHWHKRRRSLPRLRLFHESFAAYISIRREFFWTLHA